MSKAFTKEDGSGGEEALPPYEVPWPAGARNYVTAKGHLRLRAEREALAQRSASTLSPEERRRLAVLGVHLEAAEVVDPSAAPERVAFGTVVQVEGDREARYAIVGVDEVDVARGRISWLSPIARALVGKQVGDEVTLTTPRGEETLEIVAIEPLER